MVRRTKEDSERTRAKLLDAAEKLFIKKGVTETSLDDIARAAGVTRGAFYWHFTDKSDVFRAMHERVKAPMDQMFEDAATHANPAKALRDACVFALTSIESDTRTRNVFTILLLLKCGQTDPCPIYMQRMAKMREEVDDRLMAVFNRLRKEGMLARHIAPQIAVKGLHSLIIGLCMDYLRHPKLYNMKRDVPKIMDAYFAGIFAPKP